MARTAEVIYVGDAASLVRASGEAAGAVGGAEKKIQASGLHIGSTFGGMAKSAIGAAAGIAGAYAAIAGAKDAIRTTEEIGGSTLKLHRVMGMNVQTASAWASIAKVHGIETSKLSMAFGTLSKNAYAAAEAHEKGKEATSKQAEAFKALGLSMNDVLAGKTDFQGLLDKVSQGFEKLHPGVDKTALAMKLFGRGWQTIVPMFREGAEGMEGQMKMAKEMGATLDGHGVKSLEQLAVAGQRAKYGMEGLQLTFGQYVAPALTKVFTAVGVFIRELRDGTGIGGKFGQIIGQAFDFAKHAVEAFKNASTPLKIIIGAVGVALLALVSPAVAVGAAIVGATVLISTHWKEVQGVINTVVNAIAGYFNSHKAMLQSVVDAVKNVGAVVAFVWEGFILPVIRRVLPAIVNVLKGAFHVIEGLVKVIAGVLTLNFGEAWEGVKDIFSGGIELVFGLLRGATAPVREIAAKVFGGIASAASAVWDAVSHAVASLFEGAVKEIAAYFNEMYNMGKYLVEGLLKGIEAGGEAVLNGVKSIGKGIGDTIKSVLGIKSPSRVMFGVGAAIVQGLTDGLVSQKDAAEQGWKDALLFPVDAAIEALKRKVKVIEQAGQEAAKAAERSKLVEAIRTAGTTASTSVGRVAATGAATGALMFGGAPAVNAWADAHVGKFAESSGSNRGPELDKLEQAFGMVGQAWCAMFATTAAVMGGASNDIKSASVSTLRGWASQGSHGFQRGILPSSQAHPGDLMAFGSDHVGFVDHVSGGHVYTIEGNTGAGSVSRVTRSTGEGAILRPTYQHSTGGTPMAHAAAGGKLNRATLEDLWVKSGGSRAQARMAAAVALAESSGEVGQVGDQGTSFGLWQVHTPAHPQFNAGKLKSDPRYNAQAAMAILRESGWGAWTTYKTGAYKQFMGGPGGGVLSLGSAAASHAHTTTAAHASQNATQYQQAIRALADFDKKAKEAQELAKINIQVEHLEQLKRFQEAIDGLKSKMKELASQAAQAWRQIQQSAIESGPNAAALKAKHAEDEAESKRHTEESNTEALTAAQKKVKEARGNENKEELLAAEKELKRAEEAITAYARQQDEKRAEEAENTELGSLDQRTKDYEAMLDGQLNALTEQLAKSEIDYAVYAAKVNAILGAVGVGYVGDPGTQGIVTGGPGPAGAPPWPKNPAEWPEYERKYGQHHGEHRASGGRVYGGVSYTVGETGTERFTPTSDGVITPASQAQTQGGVTALFTGDVTLGSRQDADRLALSLAHRLTYGSKG